MEFAKVGALQMLYLIVAFILFTLGPVAIALIWKFKKKERFTTVLAGAGAFLLFALVLEKPIQNVLIFPTQMGLPNHPLAQFINARPILWSLLVGLFPGIFEETGRLVAFKTVLRKRKNRETSISYGIGHGGIEVMVILGLTYVNNLIYAVMINTGTFGKIVEQIAAQAPDQVGQAYTAAEQLAGFTFGMFAVVVLERLFALLFHIGASILVFYACKEKKKFWLYPLAIVLHTAMDGFAALQMAGVIRLSDWALEAVVFAFGCVVFFGALLLLYMKDKDKIQKAG